MRSEFWISARSNDDGAQRFSQVSGTFAARKIVAFGILGVRFGNGFTYSQTISSAEVTSKMRPFEPSQMSVFPMG